MNKPVRIATMRLLYTHCKPMRDNLVKSRHKYVWKKQEDGVTNNYDLPPLSKKTKTTMKKRKAATTSKRKVATTKTATKRNKRKNKKNET
jgi:hypothetical protein